MPGRGVHRCVSGRDGVRGALFGLRAERVDVRLHERLARPDVAPRAADLDFRGIAGHLHAAPGSEDAMLPYSPFQPEDLGPLAEVIPGPEPPLKLALSRIPVVQGTDAIIPVCEPTLRGNEERYVVECLRTNCISSAGHFVTRFEDMFREFCGTRYAIATTSGTTALQLALYTLGIGEGDEVLIPTFPMIASANTVRHCGAIPVFVDAEPRTWNIDVARIEATVTPRTKAIVPVHTYGPPADLAPILDVARRHHLLVIEDAAEAHGAVYKGRPVG